MASTRVLGGDLCTLGLAQTFIAAHMTSYAWYCLLLIGPTYEPFSSSLLTPCLHGGLDVLAIVGYLVFDRYTRVADQGLILGACGMDHRLVGLLEEAVFNLPLVY